MNDSIELKLESESEITEEQFWDYLDDLFYTKVFYDTDTQLYFTKNCKSEAINKDGDINSDETKVTDEIDYTEDEINTILVSFITIVAKYSDVLTVKIGEANFYDSIAEYVLQFPYYREHVEFCIRKMLSLLSYAVDCNLNNLKLNVDELEETVKDEVNRSIDINEKFIKAIGWIFHKHYIHYKKELLDTLRDYCGFTALLKVIKNYIAISKTVADGTDVFGDSYTNYLLLLFDLCKNYEFPKEISEIDEGTLNFLFDKLKIEARIENESNFLKFRLLLVLNEQYIFKFGLKFDTDQEEFNKNSIMKVMTKNIKYFQVFCEILILNFNRDMDRVDQILMLKFLYIVFLNKCTNGIVYLNDLKIIVDIIIRELFNLQLDQYDYLVNIYIRVLNCLLINTELKKDIYKKNELEEVLNYIIDSEESKPQTKKLAKKCLNCKFFNNEEQSLEDNQNNNENKIKNGSYNHNPLHIPEADKCDILLQTPGKIMNTLKNVTTTTGHHIISQERAIRKLHLEKAPFILIEKTTKMTGLSPQKIQVKPPPPPPHILHRSSSATVLTKRKYSTPPPPPPPPVSTIPSISNVMDKQNTPITPPSTESPSPSGSIYSAPQLQMQHVSPNPSSNPNSSAPPPPPPPSRPYLRTRNVSANDISAPRTTRKHSDNYGHTQLYKPMPPPSRSRSYQPSSENLVLDASTTSPYNATQYSKVLAGLAPLSVAGSGTPPPVPPSRGSRSRQGSVVSSSSGSQTVLHTQ